MFENNISHLSEIEDIINEYDKNLTCPELISDQMHLNLYDVFTVVYNFRFSFKKPKEFTTQELWQLLENKPSSGEYIREL